MTDTEHGPHAYRWIGNMRPDGQPEIHLGNRDIPAEDLGPEFVAAMSDFQRAGVTRYLKGNDTGDAELYEPMTVADWNAAQKTEADPKWWTARQEEDAAAGLLTIPRDGDETQKAYLARTADMPRTAAPPAIDENGLPLSQSVPPATAGDQNAPAEQPAG